MIFHHLLLLGTPTWPPYRLLFKSPDIERRHSEGILGVL